MKIEVSWLHTGDPATQPPGGFELGKVRPRVHDALFARAFHKL